MWLLLPSKEGQECLAGQETETWGCHKTASTHFNPALRQCLTRDECPFTPSLSLDSTPDRDLSITQRRHAKTCPDARLELSWIVHCLRAGEGERASRRVRMFKMVSAIGDLDRYLDPNLVFLSLSSTATFGSQCRHCLCWLPGSR